MKIPFQIIPALTFLIAVSYYYQFTAQYTPRTFGDWNYTTGMDHVHAPLLVIHGERDTLGSEASCFGITSVSISRNRKVLGNGALNFLPYGKLIFSDYIEY